MGIETDPALVRKAVLFYNKHIYQADNIRLKDLHRIFSLEVNSLDFKEFVQITSALAQAKLLANKIEDEILKDYIITEQNTIVFKDKNGEFRRRYSNGVQEFLEEILRSKGLLGLAPETAEESHNFSM